MHRAHTLSSLLAHRTVGWLALGLLAALATAPARAGSDFSTGVSDDRLSLPEGPGSLEGLGDNVEVEPNMAQMKWQVPILLPKGFAGATPSLELSYSSGGGQSVVGMGWSLGAPAVERMTARGLPEYGTRDLFAAGGELVRVSPDWNPVAGGAIYRARMEGGFARFLWHDDASSGTAGHWEAQYPDGSVAYFGADHQGAHVATARDEGSLGTFRYLLVEKLDVHGHAVRYSYTRDPGGRALLEGIQWVFDDQGQARYSVRLLYEDRPDHLSDASSGVELEITRRVSSVEVYSGAERIRRYLLRYDPESVADGRSRLIEVETRGLDDSVYPVTHRFGYQNALGAGCQEAACGQPVLVPMGTLGASLSSGLATLVDLNGDALPDVVDTSQPGAHRIFINQMDADGRQSFATPFSSAVGTAAGHTLGTAWVQVLDANGDGFSDLLNAMTGEVLLNKGGGDWDSVESLGGSNGYPTSLGEDAELRFLDYNDDKRIDVVHSDAVDTFIYRNLGEAGFAEDPAVEALGAGFASDNLQFADMNGDGLLDAVRVRQSEVSYRINLGWGHWTAWRTITGLPISDTEVDLALLEDLNGDALADLLVVTSGQVRYALNRNGTAFATAQTVNSAIGGTIPERSGSTVVLAADLNGNGSTDILWVQAGGQAQFLDLFPVRPHLMSRIENGIGRISDVTYSTSVLEAARDAAAGDPWVYKVPFPMTVVSRVDEYDLLSNVHDVTIYDYRDGYYDGVEKAYRGYEDVEITMPGDSQVGDATGFVVSSYDVGADDPYRAGLHLSQTTESDGVLQQRLTFIYGDDADCPVAGVPLPAELVAMGRKPVRAVCKVREITDHIEGLTQDRWVTTESRYTYDGYGNTTLEADLGIVAIGAGGCQPCTDLDGHACGTQCLGDEQYEETTFVDPAHTGGRWILNRPVRARHYRDPASDRYAETLTYYDGQPFEGLPLGELTLGLPSRVTHRVDTAGAVIVGERTRHNDDGMVAEVIDPNGSVAEADAHRRTYAYDADGLRITRLEIRLEDDAGVPYQLRREVAYDTTFGKPIDSTDWMRVEAGAVVTPRNSTSYSYDAFGRIVARANPGDTLAAPSEVYSYTLRSPASQILTRKRSQAGQPYDIELAECYDGRGRLYQKRGKIADGAYQVDGFVQFNLRGEPQRKYQGYLGTSAACDTTPPTGVEHSTFGYDALDRLTRVTYSDGDLFGDDSYRTITHGPLTSTILDEEATSPTSPNQGVPLVQRFNGVGQLVQVDRLPGPGGDVESVKFTYDDQRNPTGYVDAAGHRKRQTYDLAGRLLQIEDPNAGSVRFERDARGNPTRITDARGRVTVAVYDGNNRLLERYEQNHRDETLARAYYDKHPSCDSADCTNLAGRIAGFAYPAGGDAYGYDTRLNRIFEARTLDGHRFAQRVTYDGVGRRTRVVYPDGRSLDLGYDGQSRLTSVSDLIDAIAYDPRGEIAAITYASGLVQERSYNSRGELERHRVVDAGGDVLLGAALQRNRLGQLTRSEELRTLDDGELGLDATWTYDARRRLTRATLEPGRGSQEVLDFSYDGTDNLVQLVSSLGEDSPGHVGDLGYSSSHPNAVASAGDLELSYDAAGNLQARGDLALTWDFMGRLSEARQGGELVARFDYDATRVRVRRDQGGSVTQYINPEFVVRDGVASITPVLGGLRLAEIDDAALQTQLFSDVGPLAAPDGEINAGDAWLATADEAGVLEAGDDLSPSERLLFAAARRLLHEHGPGERILHHDPSGSVVMTSDAQGQVLGRRAFMPYGAVRFATGDLGHYGYAGQERDDSTGFLHYANRLYDPSLGRWISVDPAYLVFTAEASGPTHLGESLTAYAYVDNDPINGFDPDGTGQLRNKIVGQAFKSLAKGLWKVIKSPYTLYKWGRGKIVDFLRPAIMKHPKFFAALRITTALIGLGVGIAATVLTFGAAAPAVMGIIIGIAAVNTAIDIVRTVDSARSIVRLNDRVGLISEAEQKLYNTALDHIGGGLAMDIIGIGTSAFTLGTTDPTKAASVFTTVTSLVSSGLKQVVADHGAYEHSSVNKAAHES